MPEKLRPQHPRWHEAFFVPPARFRVAYGGRGGSKSWCFADQSLVRAVTKQERILCLREVQLSIRDSSKRLIEDRIKALNLTSVFQIQRDVITCTQNGTEYTFHGLHGASAENIKSFEGATIAWVEEANTVCQDSIDVLLPTIRQPNSEIWFSYNAKQKSDPVHKMFVIDEPPPHSIVTKINYPQNPWFPKVLRDQMEWDRERDPDKYRHIWLGEPVAHTDAQVLGGRWSIAPIPTPPGDVVYYHGADWGFANDPTTLIRCWIDWPNMILYLDRAVGAVGVEIDHTPALFRTVETAEAWEIIGDCARPETISYMNRNGFNVKSSKKGKGSVEDGIEFLRQFDIVVAPDLKDVQDECALYSYKVDKRTGQILPTIVDKNNHYIDALRYALEKLMRVEDEAFLFSV